MAFVRMSLTLRTEGIELATSTAKRARKDVAQAAERRTSPASVKGTAYGRQVIKVLRGFKGGPFKRPNPR